jgi:3-oxoacyl-[acyl-carrier-protein] synthase I
LKKIRVAITGIGAVSAAGIGVDAFEQALLKPSRVFSHNTRHDLDLDVIVGEAREEWFATHDHPDLDSPTGRLCLSAARECEKHSRENGAGSLDGLSLGTSTGGQSVNERVVFDLLNSRDPGPFNYRRQGCMAAPSRLVARDLGIEGPVRTTSTACTSSANAIALGASWILSGKCRAVLAGGGDALCHTTISSFCALELTGPRMCTPFAADRPGLTLGEGAGFLVLESLEEVLAAGRKPIAELLGVGMSSDAHHMTAPPQDGSGAEAAMRAALWHAGLSPSNIHHVNAHGTGTQLNDSSEAKAIDRLFDHDPPVMSCKGLIGHTLGGAGGLEAVASVLALRKRTAFTNLGADRADPECPVSLVGPGGLRLPDDPVIISNSFAFGGNNCSLIFAGQEVSQ